LSFTHFEKNYKLILFSQSVNETIEKSIKDPAIYHSTKFGKKS